MVERVCCLWLLLATVAAAQAPATRLPVPTPPALATAEQVIAEVYQKDLEAAKFPPAKQTLAKKLLEDALKTQGDPPAQFAALDKARALAAQAGDIDLAYQVADKIGERFQVSSPRLQALSLLEIEKNLRLPEDYFFFGRYADRLFPALRKAGHWREMTDLAKKADDVAQKARDPDFARLWRDRVAEVAVLETLSATGQTALAKLDIAPTDRTANESAGRWKCLVLEDWDAGIPLLALAQNPALQKLAARELSGVTVANDRLRLADDWVEVAKTLDRYERQAAVRHASALYKLAEEKLDGLPKARATKGRLETFGEGMPLRTPLASLPARIWDVWGDARVMNGRVAGRSFPNTLNGHPLDRGKSRIVFDLPADCKYLVSAYAFNDMNDRPHHSVQFRMIGDDNKPLWAAPMRFQTVGKMMPFKVDLRGQRTIELFVDCDNFNGASHAIWVEPLLQR